MPKFDIDPSRDTEYRKRFAKTYMVISDNLLETIDYNEPTTPIKATISYLSDHPNKVMPVHWHKELECIIVLDGEMNYYVNDKTYPLHEGDAIIVNTNRLHLCGPIDPDAAANESADCRYAVLLLQPDSLRFNLKMEEKYINPLLFDLNSDVFYLNQSEHWHQDIVKRLLSIFHAIVERTPCFELTSQSDFFALWSILYQNTIAKNGSDIFESDPMSPLKQMLSYIQDHYQDKVTLNDIAESGMMCQSKCCRLFRENLRQSPVEYLQNYRIQRGIYLLDHTTMNITEISLECGFQSASYFTETFRKMNGISPKEYRKQIKA